MSNTLRWQVFFPLTALLLASPVTVLAQVYVQPYLRGNGTMVPGHWRSRPDSNPTNNYGYPGNRNPYDGRIAPGNPDSYLRNYYRDRQRSPLDLSR
ncbi:MAG TPA: hypothetical protein VNL98_10105 [Gemmatimonadales bacterium]|nr:hypothetical protein [Gemmatimonadales bacterium]